MERICEAAKKLFALEPYECTPLPGHGGGRNHAILCRENGENKYILRVSPPEDRSEEDILAETEFVRYLAENGAPVADVIPSVSGKTVECAELGGKRYCLTLFAYAKGMLLSDNGYRYREGAPLSEYFFNTGKALVAIHRLSKRFRPTHRRPGFFDKYGREYFDRLIPDDYAPLKSAVAERMEEFRTLPADTESWGLVHFDFNDGNYHVDMDTGRLTVFDFDNCLYCWYMFDLACLWINGEGWCRGEKDAGKRMEIMNRYFETVLRGYRSETDISDALFERLPLFIDMLLFENIAYAFECAAREGEAPDEEDFGRAAACLTGRIPYAGIGAG